MHKNTDFHIEQTRLNDTYRKLNSGNDFSSYINEQENQSPTYWSFLKLRIGFSILFLFFLIACFKTAPAKEFKKVQSAFSHINQTDSYSEHILNQFDLNFSSCIDNLHKKEALVLAKYQSSASLFKILLFIFLTITADKTIFRKRSSY